MTLYLKIIRCFLLGGLLFSNVGFALEPENILILANGYHQDSIQIARYYAKQRNVPEEQIFYLNIPTKSIDQINRFEYDNLIRNPIRKKIQSLPPNQIKCLLSVYGIPYQVDGRGRLKEYELVLIQLQDKLTAKSLQVMELNQAFLQLAAVESRMIELPEKNYLYKKFLRDIESNAKTVLFEIKKIKEATLRNQTLLEWFLLYGKLKGKTAAQSESAYVPNYDYTLSEIEKMENKEAAGVFFQAQKNEWSVFDKLESSYYQAIETSIGLSGVLLYLLDDIAMIEGDETGASVDSELSMVLFDDYELYRWHENELKRFSIWTGAKTLMVSRLDGPGADIARGLINKAIETEQQGLQGTAYIDSRYPNKNSIKSLYGDYDRSLKQLSETIKEQAHLKVVYDDNQALFPEGCCPEAALYCGWYSLGKYNDAFEFAPGAIGYHIASYEAIGLRKIDSRTWCPSMLRKGITATLGPIKEPYLAAFPLPHEFFKQLFDGKCLVEAYYRTKPFNSWQMVLIGDPLYTPFKKKRTQ